VANSLTAGDFLTGGPYNGSGAVTLDVQATHLNTINTVVARDNNGNFAAGTITATSFSGSGSALTALDAAKITAGTLAVSRGGTGRGSLAANKVLVGNDTSDILQPTNLHWDNANSRLGIGTSTPAYPLDVSGTINAGSSVRAQNLVVGTQANKATLAYTTNAARTYSIPDAGGNANFVMTAGNQTIGGIKTFTVPPEISSGTGSLVFGDSSTTKRGILGLTGGNDYWFVGGGATALDAGFMEISTGDNGSEPIYVRQYNGIPTSGTINRSLTLLDSTGNSTFPGTITATSFSGSGSALTGFTATQIPSLDATKITTGSFSVTRGGTGRGSLAANKVLVGNDISGILQPTNLHWDNTNSRLGIGTSSPAYPLDVNGDVRATNFRGNGSLLTNVSASDNTKLPLTGGTLTGTLRSTFIIPTLNGSYTLGNQNFKYAESHTVKAFPDQLRVNTEDTGLAQCYVNGTTIIDITQPSFGGRSFGVASGFFPTGFPDYNFQVVPDVVFLGNQSGSVKPEPVDNNKTDIGVPSFRFRTIFLVNNPNVSSDINDKIDIQTLENDLGLSFINAIRPVQYRSNPRTNYIRAKKQIDYIEVSDKDKVFSSAPTLKLDPGGEAHVVLDETGRIQDIIIDKNYTIDHRSVFFAQFPEFPDFVLKVITRRCDECTTNDGSLAASRTSYGVIAQEIEAIRPSFHGVSKDTNETTGQVTYSFDYSSLVPCLIRAVQELNEENASLKAKNASLEERIAAIEAHLGIA
jgi:hypothetical protein